MYFILQTVNQHNLSENFLEVSSPLRRTSSLPDLIGDQFDSIENEINVNTKSDKNQSKCINDCVNSTTIPYKSDKSIDSPNLEVREVLVERRKSFFIDMNSNPRLQITSV